MKKITLLCAMAILCLCGKAQQNTSQALYINDRLPDITLDHLLNYPSHSAKLSVLQTGNPKMVVFGFWLTSCAPCIRRFPLLDSLQNRFQKDLQIILVTPEKTAVIENFLKKWETRNQKPFTIPIVTADTLIQQYFREQSKPSYAWLARDNVYMAHSSSTFLSADIIENTIRLMNEQVRQRGYLKSENQNNVIK